MRPLVIFVLISVACINSVTGTKIPTDVIELNERFLEVKDQGFWLVKLYAPWCAHCKRLAPIWEHVGHALADQKSPVRVGKVDCTRFGIVGNKLRISGYPTIIFFRNGVQIPYEGERTKEAIVNFALKSSGPIVQSFSSKASFDSIYSRSKEAFFVFVGGIDNELWKSYDEAAGKLFTQTKFFRADHVDILPKNVQLQNRPTVLVFKEQEHFEYTEADGDLDSWIRRERWVTLPLITSTNIHDIAEDTQKKLILAAFHGVEKLDDTTFNYKFFKHFTEAAKAAKKLPGVGSAFQFGWLDGTEIANSIVMKKVDTPYLFALNLSSYEFYEPDDVVDESTTPESIVTFARTVADGFVAAQGGRSWAQRIKRMVYEVVTNVSDMFHHQPILTSCLFGVPIAFFSIITYSLCSSDFSVDRDEIYPEDEEDEDGEYSDYSNPDDKQVYRRRNINGGGEDTDLTDLSEGEPSKVTGSHAKAE